MPLRQPRRAGLLLKTGQTTPYSSELDDGYYEKGLAKRYTVLTTGQYALTSNIDLIHLTRTDISFDSATDTITCAGQMGLFKAAGGQTIVVTGSTFNNGTYTTASATADTIVVNEALADEAAGASVSIAKREALSNNCVLDLNTGLMWARYTSVQNAVMGSGSDGKMPWTGQLYDIFQWCAAANVALLGGYSDWRIPNVFEIVSLADYEPPNSYPDATAFPSWIGTAAYMWTSSVYTPNVNSAMSNMSSYGRVEDSAKSNSNYAVLVRGGV